MLLPLPTPAEMMNWDRVTISSIGIPGATLMESASRESITALLAEFGSVEGQDIICFAGSGNNGGDGFAMARALIDLGANVTVYHTRPKKQYRGETRSNLLWAQKLDVPLIHLANVDLNTLPQPDIIIDALLGTGFDGQLHEDYLELVRTMNRLGERAFVFSVDIPSGLNGLTGTPQPEAVVADVTATFEAAKLGLIMPEAETYTGILHICPIGIPLKVQNDHPASHNLITGAIMDTLPPQTPDMHKNSSGHVLVVGAAPGMTGAAHLAAMSAFRSGAGLVTAACPEGLADSIKADTPEIMTLIMGSGNEWNEEMVNPLLKALTTYDAVVVGPGIGRSSHTQEFLKAFIPQCSIPLVLDADGLFALANYPELLNALPEQTVLTPHPGEMARILKTDIRSIQSDRLGTAKAFTAISEATLVLKGAGTIVTNPDMTCHSPFSEPNLAVGGSGDILAGMIGTLLGRALSPMHAACLGVFWHGLAGHALREDFPKRGNMASDIINMLPKVVTS
ncbi:NAD(P)H-hydrate dehydratase [Pseudodesulfovibrio sediminis]|uniref:Bifunctional NAD(P)H-hydrate repair enzyme n=1 Tax=Pseudodesulfovibrio sediminis TaxID=2810563 RepID=A0ABN6EPA2_9BACT|nr:NAD(P)H-hydrate dehydratase [Pseudodesulfovibrio sediminis]BCS87049.1 bifunctional NAD(P)H-hydrate repair enzyme Nnr [Pseudodesulfovibrio sediminis]